MSWQVVEEMDAERAADADAQTPGQAPIRGFRAAVAWLIHNTVAHTFAGFLWFAADLGAGAWARRIGDKLHDSTVPVE